MNINHEHYEERLGFIHSTLKKCYGLEIKSITPIAYDTACPFPFNNFIYLIESEPSKPLNSDTSLKPGTASLPESTTHLVMRLANATALGLNGTNRVENEVAAMSLARNALSPDHLVPDVYGWCTAGSASGDDQGWILMQHMPGCDLDTVFEKLSLEEQKPILSQIAEIFAKIQRCEIPSTVEGFGGLTFDERGCMVGGEMSLVRGGPFGTYVELWQGMLREELKCADESEVIAGWRQNDVREKIEGFVEKGVPNMVGDAEKKVLCHGDFTTNNLLFDEKTAKVTAIIDFDFAHITAPAEEFLRSFWTLGGNVLGGESPSSLIHGFPEPHSETTLDPEVEKSRFWDSELLRLGADRPSTIPNMEALASLHEFMGQLSPHSLVTPQAVKRKTKEELDAMRMKAERALLKALESWRF